MGVDGSPDSRSALRWAGRLATATGLRLRLAHAWGHGVRPDGAFASTHTNQVALESDVTARLQEVAGQELDDHAVVAGYAALRGPTAAALDRCAWDTGAQLIVVGTRGSGGAARVLLGSVSRELASSPAHAVAVIPEHDASARATGAEQRLLVAHDGSDGAARALRWAGAIARRAGAEVVVVHAHDTPVPHPSTSEEAAWAEERRRRVVEEWSAPLQELGITHRAVLGTDGPHRLVRQVADAERPLCCVVGAPGERPFPQRLLGSLTDRLVKELAWPIVVVPGPHDRPGWPIED